MGYNSAVKRLRSKPLKGDLASVIEEAANVILTSQMMKQNLRSFK